MVPEELFEESGAGTLFAELLLPVPIPRLFTYRVPRHLTASIRVGQRGIVPFGARKIITGVVAAIHTQPPKDYEAKYLLELLDETEVLTHAQFDLYQWIASYYLCTAGEVLNAALPSGLKLSSESMIQLNPSFREEESTFEFSEKEELLITRLRQDVISYSDAVKLLGARNIYALLKSLTAKEAIILFEEVREKYRPKTEKRIRLAKAYLKKKELEKLFLDLAEKPKQEAVVLKYLQVIPVFNQPEDNNKGLRKNELLSEELSESSLATLIKHGVFEEFEVAVPRFSEIPVTPASPFLLSEAQEKARNEIVHLFEEKNTCLLQGVTGSGKTEIYIDLIRRALEGGSQALYLLPEIALTTQIVIRLKRIFGNEMGVYHSKFSDNERVEVWNGVLEGKFRLVVGVRSSVFLPFDNLGLIIVDEEHDSSYKQHDPAPRYHARDVALLMAQQHHAKVLLGSATPSVESYYQCRVGKFGHVRLTERFGESQLPDICFADRALERKRKSLKGEFTSLLLREIAESLQKNEQVILFQNRRGYSPIVQCDDCEWIPKCINCAVSLTYHQYRHAMICHYCGYKEEMPHSCPSCSSKRILSLGYGTEKLEEELQLHFPDTKVQRMDLDTTRTKSGYESIIEGFEKGETQILVGTQMVTKGLDFDRVSLVGIFDADRMMHFPDFRSFERAFQLITQVSGRAGRRSKKGKVVIQTSHPDHPLFAYVRLNDVNGFLEQELADREANLYPPFSRLIEITVKHIDRKISKEAAALLAHAIEDEVTGIRLLGPGEPVIGKIRNEYLMTILLKIPRNQGKLTEIKSSLQTLAARLTLQKEYRQVRIQFDVDPA